MKKKALLIVLTAVFGIGALSFAALKHDLIPIVSVLATEEPEEDEYAEERENAKAQILELACLDEYSGKAREELEAKIAEVNQEIDRAPESYYIDAAVNNFRVYLEYYFYQEYYPSLGYYKGVKKWDVECFTEDFSIDPNYEDLLNQKIEEAKENIENSTSIEEIDRKFEEFCHYFEFVFYRTYRVFDELKQEVLDYVDWTLDKIDEYDEEHKIQIQRSAQHTKEVVNQATTNAQLYSEYDKYKDFFEKIPTLVETQLKKVIEDLLSDMHIACTIGEMSLGNTHEVDVFHIYYDWAYADIENAKSVEEAYEFYEGFLNAAEEFVPDIRERIELYKGGYRTDVTDPDTKGTDSKDKETNSKIALIVVCALEGGVILIGAAGLAFYFNRNKKRKSA
ncbi:MAG: hypothetical protein KBS97_03740 [Firmicutes bacterium]|nr:hypothetical protein [Candidatus Fiminaster equi]